MSNETQSPRDIPWTWSYLRFWGTRSLVGIPSALTKSGGIKGAIFLSGGDDVPETLADAPRASLIKGERFPSRCAIADEEDLRCYLEFLARTHRNAFYQVNRVDPETWGKTCTDKDFVGIDYAYFDYDPKWVAELDEEEKPKVLLNDNGNIIKEFGTWEIPELKFFEAPKGQLPPPPILNNSGRGYHGFYKIEHDGDQSNPNIAADALEAITTKWEADPTCKNLGRLLRIPKTPNFPGSPTKVHRGVETSFCDNIHADWETTFPLTELILRTCDDKTIKLAREGLAADPDHYKSQRSGALYGYFSRMNLAALRLMGRYWSGDTIVQIGSRADHRIREHSAEEAAKRNGDPTREQVAEHVRDQYAKWLQKNPQEQRVKEFKTAQKKKAKKQQGEDWSQYDELLKRMALVWKYVYNPPSDGKNYRLKVGNTFEWKNYHQFQKATEKMKTGKLEPAEIFSHHPDRPEIHEHIFHPGKPSGEIDDDKGEGVILRVYNDFTPIPPFKVANFSIKKDPKGRPEYEFIENMKDLFSDGDLGDVERPPQRSEVLFRFGWNWFARAIYFPYLKGETALFIRGDELAGKSYLFRKMLKFFGPHGRELFGTGVFDGEYNYELRNLVFAYFDEVSLRSRAALEKLKNYCTEDEISLHGKYMNIVNMPNYLHLAFSTNEEWAVGISKKGRRFVLATARTHDRLGVRKTRSYFDQLDRDLANGGWEGLAAQLEWTAKNELEGFRFDEAPEGIGKKQNKRKSQNPVRRWLLERLVVGHLEHQGGKMFGVEPEAGWPGDDKGNEKVNWDRTIDAFGNTGWVKARKDKGSYDMESFQNEIIKSGALLPGSRDTWATRNAALAEVRRRIEEAE